MIRFSRARTSISFVLVFLLSALQGSAHEIDKQAINKLVHKWSDAHNAFDLKTLKNLYGAKVLFYCQELPVEKCLSKKSTYFNPQHVFHQEIVSDVTITEVDYNLLKCDFIKKVNYKNKVRKYPSYLILFFDGYNYEIVGESDLLTDKNLNYVLNFRNNLFASLAGNTEGEIKHQSNNYILYIIVLVFGIALTWIVLSLARKRTKVAKPLSYVQPQINSEKLSAGFEEALQVSEPPASYNKTTGDEFEKFVVNKFDTNYFTMLDWKSDKGVNGIFPESNGDPDLIYRFELREFSRQFAVECKYVKAASDTIQICKEAQLKRYKSFGEEKKISVYIILGIGGKPFNPKELFIIPLEQCKAAMEYEEIKRYSRSTVNRLFYDKQLDRLT